jgi:hypothetical protein
LQEVIHLSAGPDAIIQPLIRNFIMGLLLFIGLWLQGFDHFESVVRIPIDILMS